MELLRFLEWFLCPITTKGWGKWGERDPFVVGNLYQAAHFRTSQEDIFLIGDRGKWHFWFPDKSAVSFLDCWDYSRVSLTLSPDLAHHFLLVTQLSLIFLPSMNFSLQSQRNILSFTGEEFITKFSLRELEMFPADLPLFFSDPIWTNITK